uniref:5'-3' DNA helicase ZGRF1-like N-terminal domain-containing protein n=1 Tax=Nannospalax galili TaxID=1026970 RepID=A0A8C6QCH8_NANGA
MESQEFIVLYTHQKMKKSKVWQDGILKITRSGNKATLYDDSGACLESLFLKCFQVKPGDDLESDRYLITVEEVRTNGIVAGTQDSTKERLESSSGWRLSSGRSLGCQPCGLKRKVTGFQGPRKSHKKMVVTENGELAASHGDVTPCSTFSPPLYSKLPMFSVLGKKDINHMPTDAETIITDRNRGRSDVLSSLLSTSSFKMNSEPRDEQEYFCSLVSSRSQHSESLLINETIQRNSLPSHCLGVSPNLRSKEQILALLKSKPASMQKDLNSEITGNFPQMKPQGSSKIITKPKEKCADTQNTGNLHSELQPENATRNTSRWALYLPSQSSPECFAVDGNGTESKFEAQDDMKNLNMTELLVPKKVQLFETCAEKGACSEDKPVDNNSQSRNQDINIDIPLFCESSSSLVSCSSTKNTDLLLETDIQNNNRAPCNQNDKVCIEGLIHMANRCGTLERECRPVSSLPKIEDTQIESSLSSNSRISDIADMISKSSTDRECLNSIHEPSLPFLEVSFNLSNFETSDTDEESREDKKIFQAAESWEKEVLLANSNSCVLKSCEGKYCQEIAGKHLPLLAFSGVKPEEVFPTKENLMSEFCDRTCVGFNPGHCEDGNLGKAVEEQCGNSKSSLDLTLECTDVPMDNKERVDNPIKTIGINYGIASPANESKGINTNLHSPHILKEVTNQTPKNSDLFLENTQPSILRNHLDKKEQVLLPISCSQDHPECIELDKSNTRVSSCLFYPLGKKYSIFKNTEAYIPESQELGRISSLPYDHIEVEIPRSKQSWNTRRTSSELSEVINNISLLKSLSEHNTALESLAAVKKKRNAFQQAQQTCEADSSPEG